MKLQIDLDNKIIRLEDKVNMGTLFSKMEEMFPDLKWREFDLETNTIINWVNPIQITPPYNPSPSFPPQYPWIRYTTSYDNAGDPKVKPVTKGGVYNIDIT